MLLAISLVIAIILLSPKTPDKPAFAHPIYPTMLQGPDGIQRHGNMLWLGWLLGVLQISFVVALIAMSLNKQGRLSIFKAPIIVGLILVVAAFSLMMLAYSKYIHGSAMFLVGSFPLPTALMIYCFWPIQIIFVVIYVYYFDRGIFTPEDQEKFQAIVKARREQMGEKN